MTVINAQQHFRVLSPSETSMVGGGWPQEPTGPSDVEQSLSGPFQQYNGIVLPGTNGDWGYTQAGEYFLDSDHDGYYDTVFFKLSSGSWTVTVDGGQYWYHCATPNFYEPWRGPAYPGA
jgi:hypothetical protein